MTTISGGAVFFAGAVSMEPLAAAATKAAFMQMAVSLGKMMGGAMQPVGKPFTATMPSEGKANIDLGDGNKLQIDENGSDIKILSADGHATEIAGDPHVSVDGKHIGDFYGTTTFEMKDGTKITIQTEQSKTNPGVYYANTVTVTRGDQAMTINGVSEQTKGDLTVSMGGNGYAADAKVADGLTLHQGAGGAWNTNGGSQVTQADFDTTRPGAQALQELGAEMGQALGQFLSFGTLGGMLVAAMAAEGGAEAAKAHASHGGGRPDPFLALGVAVAMGI